jgi:hypothetical protein
VRFDRDEVLSRIDLGDLADALLGTRHPRTRSWRCPNPSHEQTGRTPPVTVFPGDHGDRWHCHGCGEGGTAIDLAIRAGPAADFRTAIAWLAGRANVGPQPEAGRPVDRRPPARPRTVELDAGAARSMAAYARVCAEHLWGPEGRAVHSWLTGERAIPAEVLLAEGIGADPGPAWLPRPDGLPRAFPAAVFPARMGDEVVFLQSRVLRPGDHRWLNPRSSFAPNPRFAMLGEAAGAHGRVVVTEGMIDGLSAVAGGEGAVALLGAATVNDETLARIARCASVAVLATDNDDAGRRARSRLRAGLTSLGVGVSDLVIPERFKDLNDWHREARARWLRTLGSAVHIATQERVAPSSTLGAGLC